MKKCLVADTEQFGGALAIPVGMMQYLLDRLSFHFLRNEAANFPQRQAPGSTLEIVKENLEA